MLRISCTPNLFWELYAKMLPLEVSETIRVLGSDKAVSLKDEEVKELLKLSGSKILAILELYASNDFRRLSMEDQHLLLSSIESAKEDGIAMDIKNCFMAVNDNSQVKFNLALITSTAKNQTESFYCLKLASFQKISFLGEFTNIMKLIVSSTSLNEAKAIYAKALFSFLCHSNNTIAVGRLLKGYIDTFHPVKLSTEVIMAPGLNDSIKYLEAFTDSSCPVIETAKYERKPGRNRHLLTDKDSD